MKIIKTVLLLLIACFLVFVCLSGNNADRPVEEIRQALLLQPAVAALKAGTEQDFRRFYGLDTSAYEGCFVFLPQNTMDVDELLVVKLKSSSQKADLEKLILKRLENQKTSFEGYGVEQTALLEQHILAFYGDYAFYAVSSDAEAWRQAFLTAIQG